MGVDGPYPEAGVPPLRWRRGRRVGDKRRSDSSSEGGYLLLPKHHVRQSGTLSTWTTMGARGFFGGDEGVAIVDARSRATEEALEVSLRPSLTPGISTATRSQIVKR